MNRLHCVLFYNTKCKCELIRNKRKALNALYCYYSLITLDRFIPENSLKWEYNVCHWFKATVKWILERLVFNDPIEIIRTRWNSGAHQSNQNDNGKISKAVPSEVQDAPYIVYHRTTCNSVQYYINAGLPFHAFRSSPTPFSPTKNFQTSVVAHQNPSTNTRLCRWPLNTIVSLIRYRDLGFELFFWFSLMKISPATREMREWKSGLKLWMSGAEFLCLWYENLFQLEFSGEWKKNFFARDPRLSNFGKWRFGNCWLQR